MILRVEPLSWVEAGGDVSWSFGMDVGDGRVRWVRGGVRVAARGAVIRAANRYVYGDWTAALLAYAAAAVELAGPSDTQAWVAPDNVATVREAVERHRTRGEPVFCAGTVEDAFQLGSPEGCRRAEVRPAS